MQADAYFAIGQSHLVCEDYARAGLAKSGAGFAVVSDGCSSSTDTDVGARLIALATESSIHGAGLPLTHKDLEAVAGQAREGIRGLDMGSSCLDATLLAAHASSGTVNIVVVGDGAVVGRRQGGELEVWESDFGGMPAYLSYLLEPAQLEGYLGEGLARRKVVHSLAGEQISVDERDISPSSFAWWLTLDAAIYDLILLFSDGVSSFCTRSIRGESLAVPLEAVVAEVASLKTTTGRFLTRRCRRFLGRFCTANNWHHADDFSVAGLYLGGGS